MEKETDVYPEARPFSFILRPHKGEWGVFKSYKDGKEPAEKLMLPHHYNGADKAFNIFKESYDRKHGFNQKKEVLADA